MISFDPEHRAVHYPPDRRFRFWIRPSILIGIGIAILSIIAASWIEVAVAGLPHVPAVPQIYPDNFAGPHGFPVWVRYGLQSCSPTIRGLCHEASSQPVSQPQCSSATRPNQHLSGRVLPPLPLGRTMR